MMCEEWIHSFCSQDSSKEFISAVSSTDERQSSHLLFGSLCPLPDLVSLEAPLLQNGTVASSTHFCTWCHPGMIAICEKGTWYLGSHCSIETITLYKQQFRMHAYECNENSERIYIRMSSTQQRENGNGKWPFYFLTLTAMWPGSLETLSPCLLCYERMCP